MKEQIFAIAPILPGQKAQTTSQSAQLPEPAALPAKAQTTQNAPRAMPTTSEPIQPQTLIDLDAPQSSRDPIAGNPLHPTSNPKQAPLLQASSLTAPVGNPQKMGNSFIDDNNVLNDKMANMSVLQPSTSSVPAVGRPIKRTDTETSEAEVFVDAEG